MMSELANDLLDAIASGNQEQMRARFDGVMNNKINDALQARKIELAQSIYGQVQAKAEQEEALPIDDAEVEEQPETVASENGTEEA
jgi:hypothetical protein